MSYTPHVFDAAPAQLVPAKDSALARIPARIYRGEFQPGVKLSIDGLATEPGVSRTPIRDAFGQLRREGLVTITSRVGMFALRLTRTRRRTSTGWGSVEPSMARWAAERPSAVQRADHRPTLRRAHDQHMFSRGPVTARPTLTRFRVAENVKT